MPHSLQAGRSAGTSPPPQDGIVTLPAFELIRFVRARELSPVEVVRAFLDRIAAVNPRINAVVTLRADGALADAATLERAISGGRAGSLAGLPFTVKDTIETGGVRTTAGSRSRAGMVPTVDAPMVAALVRRGAILLGKTNTPEFAMTYSTDNAIFGPARNPWNLDLSPGGSSGGEAAIVAAGGSPLGLGSDLGGSIRAPAAFCRVVGLRPSAARLPQRGHVPALPGPMGKMTVIGPIARSVEDIALFLSAFPSKFPDPTFDPSGTAALHDEHGITSPVASRRRVGVSQPVTESRSNPAMKIAFYDEDGMTPVAASQKQAVLGAAGVLREYASSVEHRLPPGLDRLDEIWHEIWTASGGARGLLAAYDLDESDLSPPLAKLIGMSPPCPDGTRLAAAMTRLDSIRSEMAAFTAVYPLILCPVSAGPASARSGQWTIDGVNLRGSEGFGYSYVWSLLGCPALSVPWPSDRNESASVQIVARAGHDEEAVAAALFLERQGATARWTMPTL